MLHPQARALLDFTLARGLPPTHTLTPEEARRAYRDRRAVTQPDPSEVASVEALRADGPHGAIPLRLYRPMHRPLGTPADAALPVLVYFHGGGWVIADKNVYDGGARGLSKEAHAIVVSVDYRQAPEYKFPAAWDDALAATRWVQGHAAALGIDGTRLAVGGDSAGGNLAAVIALIARDSGDLVLAYQLLIYPATDMRSALPSHTTNGQGYMLTRDTMAYFRDHYIADPAQQLDWRSSPLLHENLAGLPPALVLTAGFDPLRDEGLAYADRLSAVQVPCSYVCFERQIHGFILMGRVLEEADAAIALCAAALRRALRA